MSWLTLSKVLIPSPQILDSISYKDKDFDDFFTLTSEDYLRDKDRLKVGNEPQIFTLTIVPQEEKLNNSDVCSQSDSHSVDSHDILILSPSPAERKDPWPTLFCIPTFSHNTELALRQGNEMYLRDGTLLTSPNVTHGILEHLEQAMFSYTAYPNNAQRSAVAQALIEKHPCLKEPYSFYGCNGWQKSLKCKCGKYQKTISRKQGRQKYIFSPHTQLVRKTTLFS
jgi:hypothetical protein